MRRPLAAGLLILAVAAAGCDSEEPEPEGGRIGAGSEYVAIGDSYTAAGLTGPTEQETGCLQSEANYPHLVAEELDLDLTDVSCGGATTANVTKKQKTTTSTRPPQLDALSTSTDLVTVSLGGNDDQAFYQVTAGCVRLAALDPTGSPCTDLDAKGTEGRSGSKIEASLARTERRLVSALEKVVDAAPDARVVVVGYPQIFPEQGPCEQLPLAAGDYAIARRYNELLVDAQKSAAKKADVEYLDVFDASEGHDMCAEDPWIAGASPTRNDGAAYHPYPEEQQLVATLLIDLVT